MRALSRRELLKVAGSGGVVATVAILGSHIPDLINSYSGREIDLSEFDSAFILDPETGLYTISHPKSPFTSSETLDLKVLNRTLPFCEERSTLPEVPKSIQETTEYFTQQFLQNWGYEATILVGPQVIREVVPGGTDKADAWGFRLGPVYVSGGVRSGYVAGCIRRDTTYAAFRITPYGSSGVYVDIHLASWNSSGRQCFGIYESRTGWTFCTCVPKIDFWAVVHPISSAIAAGLPWWLDYLAWAAAVAATPLVIGILVAIPGVPPPP